MLSKKTQRRSGMPDISVITPVYNAEARLQLCIDSVLAQTFKDWELLLVDNNSEDGSRGISVKNSERDSRIRVLACETQGVSAARNAGISAAMGNYIFFLDADDTIRFDAFEILMKLANEHKPDVALTYLYDIHLDKSGKVERTYQNKTENQVLTGNREIMECFASTLQLYTFHNVLKFYNADIIRKNNLFFNESKTLGEDLEFNVGLLKHCEKCLIIDLPLYEYLRHSGESLSSKFRPDMVSVKLELCDMIVSFLSGSGNWNEVSRESFYSMYVNELYCCILNIFKNPDYDKKKAKAEFLELMSAGYTKSLVGHKFKEKLPLQKRIFLFAVARKWFFVFRLMILRKGSYEKKPA